MLCGEEYSEMTRGPVLLKAGMPEIKSQKGIGYTTFPSLKFSTLSISVFPEPSFCKLPRILY